MSMSVPQLSADERRFIRRGVALLCVAAIATAPLALQASALSGRGWALGVNAGILALVAVGARHGRIPLPWLVAGAAVAVYGVALATFRSSLAGVVSGRLDGAGLGSSALWAAAVLSPVSFLVLGRRTAVVLNVGAILAFVVVTATGGTGSWTVAMNDGAVAAIASAALCLGASGIVAELAERRALQQRTAQSRAMAAARRTAALSHAQAARRGAFNTSAETLRSLVADLVRQVEVLAAAQPLDLDSTRVGTTLQHIATTLTSLREQAERTLQRPTPPSPGPVRDTPPPPIRDDGPGTIGRLPRRLGVLAALIVLGADAWLLATTLAGRASEVEVAMASNRMVLGLVATAAVAVVLLPRTQASVVAVGACLVPPAVLLLRVDLDLILRPEVLGWLVPSWRVAVLAIGLLLFVATLIRHRELERDLAATRHEAADEEGRRLVMAASGQHQASQEAAHELKTPMTVANGAVLMLQDHGGELPDDAAQSLLGGLFRAVRRLSHRTDLLLVAAAGEPFEPERGAERHVVVQPATAVLRGAVEASGPLVGDRDLRVEAELGDADVEIDPEDLEHVMENLLVNAHKYAPPGSPILVRARLAGDVISISVWNQGGDLSPEFAARVFEPYFRAPGADERAPGTGLGLAVVRRLVVGWGGRVGCEVDSLGTTVRFIIPLAGRASGTGSRADDLVTSAADGTRH